MNPKISVIMPVYNTEKFLPEAIESILSQSFQDFEFIIIDDYSTDNSYKICEKYSKKDSRIRLLKNKENRGISYTRNKLVKLSETNYIASQDSDDISERNRLELEFNFLKNNKKYSAVSGNNIIIDEKSKIIGYRKYSNDIKNVILKKSPLCNPSSMFKKDIFLKLGGYEDGLNYGEDYDLWLKMYLAGYKLKNLNIFLLKVRIRLGQTRINRLKETIKNTINLQKKYINLGINHSFSDKIYHFFESFLLILPNSFVLYLFKKLEYKNER